MHVNVKNGIKYICVEHCFFLLERPLQYWYIIKRKKSILNQTKKNPTWKNPNTPTFCVVKTLQGLLTSHLQVWVRRGSEICCLLTSFKRVSFKNLFMVGEDMPEKTFAHKTAVKWISTHWDQENVKKYVLPRTSLPTWSLLQKINTENNYLTC